MKKTLATLLLLTVTGCTLFADKVTDVSQEAGYREAVGLVQKLVSPVIVYKLSESEGKTYLDKPGWGDMPALESMKQTFPYKDGSGNLILGILSAGSTFRIEKVLNQQSFEHSSVKFIATITSPGPFQGLEVDPTWLAEVVTYPKVPKFDPTYVEELTPAAGR